MLKKSLLEKLTLDKTNKIVIITVSIITIPILTFYLGTVLFLIFTKPVYVPEFEVVVARYNEEVEWIAEYFPTQKVTLYNKGKDDLNLPSNVQIIKLPNVGRESHSYLYHIINHYDHLAKMVVFLQGNPFDHSGKELINQITHKKLQVSQAPSCALVANNLFEADIELFLSAQEMFEKVIKRDWSDTIFNPEYPTLKEYATRFHLYKSDKQKFCVTWGAQFGVYSESIKKRDIAFYNELLETVSYAKAPVEGHYLERLWGLIFK